MAQGNGLSWPSRAVFAGSAVLALGAIVYATQHRGEAVPSASRGATVDPLIEATQRNPSDATAWLALGQRQSDAQDYSAAVASFARAVKLAPQNAEAWSAYGEAQVNANTRDPMPAPALQAFQRAASLNPRDPRARYFLAVARDLKGEHQGAIDDWLALLRDTPPGAPWETDLRRTIEQVGKINQIEVAPRLAALRPAPASPAPVALTGGNAIPGPSAEDLHAAAGMAPAEQNAMVAGMIARLEAKLVADPRNVDGWVMLMRSRMTLGDTDKAAKALHDAVAANPGAAARLHAEGKLLQVPGA